MKTIISLAIEQQAYLAIAAVIYTLALSIALPLDPSLFSNLLGMMASICYALTLIPGIIKTLFPQFSRVRLIVLLLKHRRFIGVLSFCLALNHGTLEIIKRSLNLLNLSTYLHYFQGFSMLAVLMVLTVTSSHEAVRIMKNNWRKIHQLTHLIPCLLLWHILDKMAHWSYLTPSAVMLSSILVAFLGWRQYRYLSFQIKSSK